MTNETKTNVQTLTPVEALRLILQGAEGHIPLNNDWLRKVCAAALQSAKQLEG